MSERHCETGEGCPVNSGTGAGCTCPGDHIPFPPPTPAPADICHAHWPTPDPACPRCNPPSASADEIEVTNYDEYLKPSLMAPGAWMAVSELLAALRGLREERDAAIESRDVARKTLKGTGRMYDAAESRALALEAALGEMRRAVYNAVIAATPSGHSAECEATPEMAGDCHCPGCEVIGDALANVEALSPPPPSSALEQHDAEVREKSLRWAARNARRTLGAGISPWPDDGETPDQYAARGLAALAGGTP